MDKSGEELQEAGQGYEIVSGQRVRRRLAKGNAKGDFQSGKQHGNFVSNPSGDARLLRRLRLLAMTSWRGPQARGNPADATQHLHRLGLRHFPIIIQLVNKQPGHLKMATVTPQARGNSRS